MRISLIAPILNTDTYTALSNLARELVHTDAQLRFFLSLDVSDDYHTLETIAPATISSQLPYDQDVWLIHTDLFLYVCAGSHPWLESARERERGAVVLYQPQPLAATTEDAQYSSRLDSPAHETLLALAPYADLILVSSTQDRRALVQSQLSQPERIYTLPELTHTSPSGDELSAYRFTLSRALSQIAAWTPLRDWNVGEHDPSSSPSPSASTPTPGHTAVPPSSLGAFTTALAQLRDAATVTLAGYEIRSPTPVVGPLIAWVRRNLTSHLRQPYFDPILQSQERFNWQATQALEAIARQLVEQRAQQAAHSGSGNADLSEAYAGRQSQLLSAAKRLLEIVRLLEGSAEARSTPEYASQTSLTALRAELEKLLVELQSSPAE